MEDLIIIAVLLVVIGAAVIHIVKAKKAGVKCIGCPEGSGCGHKCGEASGSGCSCGGSCHSGNE